MSLNKIAIGQLVRSAAGRDSGHIYIVVGGKEPRFVLLSDGRERSVGAPKTKNVRHVSVMNVIAREVAEKIRAGKPVADNEIRRAISALCEPDNM